MILPSVDIPEPRRQAGNGGLSASGEADQRRDLSLLRRKGHVFQHRFAALVGKPHMVEYNVAVLIGQFFAAGLHRAIQNLIHTLDIGVGADDGGKVLQRPSAGHTGGDTTSRNIKKVRTSSSPFTSSVAPCKGGGGNAQPQHKSLRKPQRRPFPARF